MIDLLKETMAIKTDGLFLVVLGPSGAGKSHFLGTYPGRTLLLYGSGESHGPASASNSNSDLLAIAWDRSKDAEGRVIDLAPDKMLKRIKDVLDPATLKAAGVKCVALDSLTALMTDLKNTEVFKQRCTGANGKHNAFKETEALIELSSGILRLLQALVDYHSIDVIATLDLQIQAIADDGLILESKPSLPTFGVAKALVQVFGDILMLARMGEKRTPVFQNAARSAASSVDRETQTTVKYLEFTPRLRGVRALPEFIDANVPAILALKGAK